MRIYIIRLVPTFLQSLMYLGYNYCHYFFLIKYIHNNVLDTGRNKFPPKSDKLFREHSTRAET